MSIRDIIEAATPGPWRHSSGAFVDAVVNDEIGTNQPVASVLESAQFGEPMPYHQNARFIATFDPEHVALMEAERVAARAFITDRASGVGFAVRKYDEWVDACKATDRYRKERGL